jgi:hypothetical protein
MRCSTRFLIALVAVPAAVACSHGSELSSPDSGTPSSARPSLGNVMAEVARRFEIAGKAATANRFELAEFEAGELEELFEGDVPAAELPKEGPTAHIPVMAKSFLQTSAPDLKSAAHARDAKAFADAFARAAAACNACHRSSEKAFIQVPSVPGRAVPDLEPLAPAASAPRPHE